MIEKCLPALGLHPPLGTRRANRGRRVHRWRLEHDVGQDLVFPQVLSPGDVMAFDFVDLNCLSVTIKGKQYDHKLFPQS